MSIPLGLFQIEIVLALLGCAYGLFGYDANNYSHTIAFVISTIMWFTSSMSLAIGIHSDGIDYTGGWIVFIFLGIGIISALIAIVMLIDTLRLHRSQGSVNMDFDMRL